MRYRPGPVPAAPHRRALPRVSRALLALFVGATLVLPLALLVVAVWSGRDAAVPVAPELWLQPAASPAHPRRFYCHLRLIYLGLSYVYGSRLTADPCARLDAIKRELYPGGYDAAPFAAHRHEVASTDLYEPTGVTLRALLDGVRRVEGRVPAALRRRARKHCRQGQRIELRVPWGGVVIRQFTDIHVSKMRGSCSARKEKGAGASRPQRLSCFCKGIYVRFRCRPLLRHAWLRAMQRLRLPVRLRPQPFRWRRVRRAVLRSGDPCRSRGRH